jgi:predicted secreted protein
LLFFSRRAHYIKPPARPVQTVLKAFKNKPILINEVSFMAKRKSICMVLFLMVLGLFSLRAGDVAAFVDLGFSPDGKVYMFAQYGVQSATLRPWAELFAVDVARNNFVAGGRLSYIHDSAAVPGQDGAGAFYRLISRNLSLAENHGVNFLTQGHLLYVALDNDALAPADNPIEFRDFNSGTAYRAALVPQITGSGSNLRSSFYINFESIAKNGSRKSYVAGSPQIKRPLVAEYRICKVVLDPRQGSVIFVIEQKIQSEAGSGYDIRYMVEALPL